MLRLEGRFIQNHGINFNTSPLKLCHGHGNELYFETVITWQEDNDNYIKGGESKFMFFVSIRQGTLFVESSAGIMRIMADSREFLWLFLSDCWRSLLDAVASLLWFDNDAEDLLWIEPAHAGIVWVVALVRESQRRSWRGGVTQAQSMDRWLDPFSPFSSFLTRHNPTLVHDRKQVEIATEELCDAAGELLPYLLNHPNGMGLPMDFPFLVRPEWSVFGKGMIVKVHPECLWFLCFPLDFFTVFPGIPGCYGRKRPEWIATKKLLSVHLFEKSIISKDLGRIDLGKALIIINDYPFFYRGTEPYTTLSGLLRRGMDLTVEILKCCAIDCSETLPAPPVFEEEIPFPNLFRWAKNPSTQKMRELLMDHNTWHVFANFHTLGQEWQLGGMEEDSLSLFDPGKEFNSGELSHIRVMRVFHCHSMGDSAELGSLLNSRATLVQKLLTAGAWRVEGSYLEEDAIVFLIFIIRYLVRDLGMQVGCNCLTRLKSAESGRLYQRVDEFMADAGYPLD